MSSDKDERGNFHRIHLKSAEETSPEDWVTIYAPLLENATYAKSGPTPHLLKALWNGEICYGEIQYVSSKKNRILWESGSYSPTDLLTVPVRVGTIVRITASDEVGADVFDYVVKSLSQV